MKKDIDDLTAEAGYLADTINAFDTILYHHLGTTMTIDKINQINGMIEALKCFADKHYKDIEAYGMKEVIME